MSYHKLKIHKHSVDSPYKLQEEFLEYIDAIATGNNVMAVQELSDLYGCIENEVQKFGMTVDHLKTMSDVTKGVFNSGTRKQENFLSYLKKESDSVISWGLGFIQVKCGDINYNFYHKDVQRFSSANSPHSHQRDFVSEIIKGELIETLYEVSEGDTPAYCGCGNLFVEDRLLSYRASSSRVHEKGDLYLRKSEEFHSIQALHGTVTKVVKYNGKSNAFVIAPREVDLIDHIPEEACWRMIEEVLNV